MCDSEAAIIETFKVKVVAAARETYDLFKDGPKAKELKKAIKRGNWTDVHGILVIHLEMLHGIDEWEVVEASERGLAGLSMLAIEVSFNIRVAEQVQEWDVLLATSQLLPGLEWPSGFKVD